MKYYIINGPNLNLLGMREPTIYGTQTYQELCKRIRLEAKRLHVQVKIVQTNHEGTIIDVLHHAHRCHFDGIIINPGAYTHTSYAILDAIKAINIPTIEVHLSDITKRETFRQISLISPACIKSIIGHGIEGYTEALNALVGEKHV